jgi:hypothetical protein
MGTTGTSHALHVTFSKLASGGFADTFRMQPRSVARCVDCQLTTMCVRRLVTLPAITRCSLQSRFRVFCCRRVGRKRMGQCPHHSGRSEDAGVLGSDPSPRLVMLDVVLQRHLIHPQIGVGETAREVPLRNRQPRSWPTSAASDWQCGVEENSGEACPPGTHRARWYEQPAAADWKSFNIN